MRGLFFLILMALVLSIFCFFFSLEDSHSQKFISIADIHFDPLAGCPDNQKPCALAQKLQKADSSAWEVLFQQDANTQLPNYYGNTNYSLLKSSLAELNKISNQIKPSFVLLLGDFLVHNFRHHYIQATGDKSSAGYELFVKKTMEFLSQAFQQIFTEIDVYPVIGNHDSYNGNYRVLPQGKFLQEITRIWSPLIKNKNNQAIFQTEFPRAGYYAIPLSDKSKILFLNSVLFSPYSQNKMVQQAANEELAWIHQQLLQAKSAQQKVILALHIPMGMDLYSTLFYRLSTLKFFWQREYTEIFAADIKQFSSIITAILPGHVHRDTFQLITLKQFPQVFINFTPSISPIYGNDPGFKVYTYNTKTFEIENFNTYYLSLGDTKTQSENSWKQAIYLRRFLPNWFPLFPKVS